MPYHMYPPRSFASISIAQEADQPLIWMQPNPFHSMDELRCGGRVIASLRYEGLFGTRATGDSERGRWTLERHGLRHPRLTVFATGAESAIGNVELSRPLGSCEAPVHLFSGGAFRWVQIDPLHCALMASGGAEVLRFARPHIPYPWITRTGGEVQMEIASAAYALEALPLLALLGRYLMYP